MSYCTNCGEEVQDTVKLCPNCGTPDYGLSAREMEVLQLLSEDYTNTEIAKALWISEHTVKKHVAHIFDKLGTSNRTGTVATALRKRLIT